MRTRRNTHAQSGLSDGLLPTHRSPITLDDLLAHLLWPKLLRSYRLAAAPGRLIMCLGLVLAAVVIDRVYTAIAGDNLPQGPIALLGQSFTPQLFQLLSSLFGLNVVNATLAARALYDLFLGVPLELLRAHWPAVVIVLPLLAAGLAITGGAVSRSVAYEVSLRATLPWRKAHRFAWSRTLGLVGVVVAPVAAVWIVAAVTALVGRLIFDWRITAVAGGLAFFIFIAIALALVLVMLLYVFAAPMLVPALAVEGSDAFDATNRAFAYVLAKPGRYAVYALVSIAVALIALGVGFTILLATNQLAAALTNAPVPVTLQASSTDRSHLRITLASVALWSAAPWLLLVSYAISLFFTSGTLLFLLMRQLVDGQDIAELWVPEEPEPAPASPVTTTSPAPAGPAPAVTDQPSTPQ